MTTSDADLVAPDATFPHPWSVRRWLVGTVLEDAADVARTAVAEDLGAWLAALRAVPVGPQVQAALEDPEGAPAGIDVGACRRIWLEATTTAWPSTPVWFHGDVAAGNLLVRHGRLAAVIDFGGCGLGDPACDLVVAWTWFTGAERQVSRAGVGLPDDTWARARGWPLWKALVTITGRSSPDPGGAQRRVLDEVLADTVA